VSESESLTWGRARVGYRQSRAKQSIRVPIIESIEKKKKVPNAHFSPICPYIHNDATPRHATQWDTIPTHLAANNPLGIRGSTLDQIGSDQTDVRCAVCGGVAIPVCSTATATASERGKGARTVQCCSFVRSFVCLFGP
jgi:hypothetical protein